MAEDTSVSEFVAGLQQAVKQACLHCVLQYIKNNDCICFFFSIVCSHFAS